MKKALALFFIFLSQTLPAQQTYSRKQFDYAKLEEKATAGCTEDVNKQLDAAISSIENNNSAQAVSIAEALYKKGEATACADLYDVYATSLFRNGRWDEGLAVIEDGIAKYGANPDLIYRKGYMCLEMADLGLGQKSIDGNGVYSGKDKDKYDEAAFKEENYKTALKDFDFLIRTFDKRYQEILIVGYIYQQLKDYESSNAYFKRLVDDKECEDAYKDRAQMFMAENYIAAKQLDQAEIILLQLEKKYPRNSTVQEKLMALYEWKKDSKKVNETKEKSYFYQLTPYNSTLEYTKENYATLRFFADEKNSSKAKSARLKELVKKSDAKYTVEICLSILKMHANHGNGIEEEATQCLIKLNKAAVEPVIDMFVNDEVSTCTMTNLADVLATVKDPRGWEPLVNYLPAMVSMPMTVIPPMVPQMIIKFDKEEGTKVLVEFVKPIVQNEKNGVKNESPFADLNFSENLMFSALKDIKKEKIIAAAKQYEYSEEEMKILLDKIYKE